MGMLDDTRSLKAPMLRCKTGEDFALRGKFKHIDRLCKLNRSHLSSFLPTHQFFLFIVLSPLCQFSSFFSTSSLCPLSVQPVMSPIWLTEDPSLSAKQKEPLKQSSVQGLFLQGVSCLFFLFFPNVSSVQVSHVLNVAHGVPNLFPDQMVYKTLQILDLPDTQITPYLEECSSFIYQAREQDGVVLVHCNAGVSRSSSIVIGYLMLKEGLPFDDAYSQVKLARPSIRPNPGFYQQLQNYTP
ncbi:uncharacterized protein [Nothobranchius furzeri]|uniref:uncharacterized protein isoform X1 n=1 Tax=Nothobranchius furzeri TaxID=105023 RepID=UPI0039049852